MMKIGGGINSTIGCWVIEAKFRNGMREAVNCQKDESC